MATMLLTKYQCAVARWQRVVRLQRWLASDANANKIEAICVILGVDGDFNRDSQQFVNYTLLGLTGHELSSASKGCQGREDLDNLVLVITASVAHIICSQDDLQILLPKLSCWRNMVLHCLSGKDGEDSERADDFKLASFVNVLKPLKKVGIPVDGAAISETIEKWPLVQGFAHEESGGGGFFSLVHDPVDISPILEQQYNTLDALAVAHVLEYQLPQFTKQWVNYSRTALEGKDLTSEVFSIYWKHAQQQHQGSIDSSLKPKVTQTEASAVIVEVHDPLGPLSCIRTSFDFNKKENVIVAVYNALIDLIYEGALMYCDSSSDHFLNSDHVSQELLLLFMQRATKSIPVNSSFSWVGYSSLSCTFRQRDYRGCVVEPLQPSSPFSGLLSIELRATSLPIDNDSTVHTGEVAVGETFDAGALFDVDCSIQPYLITNNIDYAIPIMSEGVKCAENIAENCKCSEKGELLTSSPIEAKVVHFGQQYDTELYFFECGIIMRNRGFGDIHLTVSPTNDDGYKLAHAKLVLENHDILQLEAKGIDHYWGPCSLDSIIVKFGSHSRHRFLNEVWSTWHSSDEGLLLSMPVMASDIISQQALKHLDPRQYYTMQIENGLAKNVSLVDVLTYNKNLAACRLCIGAITSPTLQSVNMIQTPKQFGHINLTILTGVPGSGKARVSSSIIALTKASTRWIVLRPELDWDIEFSPLRIQRQLQSVVQSIESDKEATTPMEAKYPRLLLITAGYVDIVEVVRAIKAHPDTKTRSAVHIGGISCCIDPNNFFWENWRTFPNLLKQLSDGWCNNILLTGQKASRKIKDRVVSLVRVLNPIATLVECEDGRVTSDAGFEAILTTSLFEEARQQLNRFQFVGHLDGYAYSEDVCSFQSESMLFTDPLDKKHLTQALHDLERKTSRLSNIFRIKGRIYLINKTAEGLMYEWYKIHFVRRSGHVSVARVNVSGLAENNKSIVQFIGTDLKVAELQAWLEACVPAKPVRIEPRTRESITHEEYNSIRKELQKQPLPQGYFHNGRQYVCMDGTKSNDHPLFDDMISNWLRGQNAEIEKHNLTIKDDVGKKGLFSKKTTSPMRPSAPPPLSRLCPAGRPGGRRSVVSQSNSSTKAPSGPRPPSRPKVNPGFRH